MSGPEKKAPLAVIPTYNERETISDILRAILKLPGDWHALIVDDNSPDGTGEVADLMAAAEPRISVLHREGKEGLGPAYRAAFRYLLKNTDYQYIGQLDADFSHDPNDLPRLLEALGDAGLAIGSRYVAGGSTKGWGLRRRILSRLGNAYVRVVLGTSIHDMTAGFRVWHRKTLADIDLDAVTSRGYGFQIEMAARAIGLGHRVVEIPICFTERRAGKSKMSGSIIAEALLLPWKLRRLFQ